MVTKQTIRAMKTSKAMPTQSIGKNRIINQNKHKELISPVHKH